MLSSPTGALGQPCPPAPPLVGGDVFGACPPCAVSSVTQQCGESGRRGGLACSLARGVVGLLQWLPRALAPAYSQGTGIVGPGRGWGRVGMERGVSIRRGLSLGPVLSPALSRPPLLVGLSAEMLN